MRIGLFGNARLPIHIDYMERGNLFKETFQQILYDVDSFSVVKRYFQIPVLNLVEL